MIREIYEIIRDFITISSFSALMIVLAILYIGVQGGIIQ